MLSDYVAKKFFNSDKRFSNLTILHYQSRGEIRGPKLLEKPYRPWEYSATKLIAKNFPVHTYLKVKTLLATKI